MSTVPNPAPAPINPLPPRSTRGVTGSFALWGIGLAIAAGVGYYFVAGTKSGENANNHSTPSIFGSSPTTTPTPTAATTPDPDAEAKKNREAQAVRDDEQRRSEAAARLVPLRARIAALKADGDAVRDALTRFDALATNWKTKYEPLCTDEARKRIAASPTHLALAATVFAHDRVTDRQRAGWGEQLDHLLAPAVQADRDPNTPVVVADDTLALITKLLTTVRAAVKDLESDTAVLESMKAATASMTPSPNTFTQALEQRTIVEKTAELTRVEDGRKAALKKQADALAAIEQKKIDAETEIKKTAALAELHKVEFEKKQKALALKVAEDKVKADLAKAQLLADYEKDLPTIKLTLPAFITAGKSYRQKGSNGPLSLAFIQGKEALEDSRKGLTAFCRIARQDNDRPPGPIPYADSSELSWQRLDKDAVRKAQNLIIKYGAIMVEKGLLDP